MSGEHTIIMECSLKEIENTTNDGSKSSQLLVKILRLVSFIFAFLSMCMAFSVFAFTVYMGSIKSQFNYSQSQVELLMSMEFIGLAFTLPAGRFIEKYGNRAGVFVGMIFSGGSHFLVWSACNNTEFYSNHFIILVFYFLLLGFGNGLSYLTAISATIGNFSEERRCTAVSVLSSATSMSGMILIAIWNAFFHNPVFSQVYNFSRITLNATEVRTQLEGANFITTDLADFFLMLAISYTVINFGCTLFYGKYLPEDAKRQEKRKASDIEDSILTPLIVNRKDCDIEEPLLSPSIVNKGYGTNKRGGDLEESMLSTLLVSKGYGTITYNDESNPILRSLYLGHVYNPVNKSESLQPSQGSKVRTKRMQDKFEDSDSGYSDISDDIEVHVKNTSSFAPLASLKYHCIAWPSILLLALSAMNGANINTYLSSLQLDKYEESIPFIIQWFGIPSKLIMGWVSDAVIKRMPRSGFVVMACVMNAAAFILCLFFLDELAIIIISQFCTTFGSVVVWCLCPSIIIEEFGEKAFMVLWGFIQFNYGVTTFLINYMFGAFYDRELQLGEETCYGKQCFLGINIVTFIVFVITTFMSVFFLKKRSRHD